MIRSPEPYVSTVRHLAPLAKIASLRLWRGSVRGIATIAAGHGGERISPGTWRTVLSRCEVCANAWVKSVTARLHGDVARLPSSASVPVEGRRAAAKHSMMLSSLSAEAIVLGPE